jgi:predicted aspartyl protease
MTRLLAIVALVACHAPADPLARFHTVSGGSQWANVHYVETHATIAVGGMTGTTETIEDLATGRHRSSSHLGSLVLGDGFDGTTEWELAVGGEVVTPDDPKALEISITNRWLTQRGYFLATGARYVDRGRRDHYHVIEATPQGGAPIELWFDDANGLLAKTKYQSGPNTVVTTYDDYRGVSGLMFPFHEVIDVGDPRNLVTITTTDVHIRNGVGDEAFARPRTDDRLTIAATTEVPFDLVNNHIYIHAQVDGKPVRMIVDTGGLNLLTPAAAAKLGLAASGKMAARGAGEKQIDLAYANGTSLEVGAVKLAHPVFYVIDLGALDAVEGELFDGLVGFELFQRLAVRIDYPGHKLVLSKRDDFTPPAGAIAVPFELRDRTPVISGEIDGIAARITIDTGARNSLSTTSPFTKQHELEKRYQPKFETVTGWGVGGPVKGKPVRFKRVKMGEVSVDDVAGDLFTGAQGALADPDSSANLGGGILRRFVVTFDYRDKKMYLQPGPPVRDVFDRAGMFFLGDEHGLRIVAVVAGGPAERAGIAAEDHITGIDREPVADRQTPAWRDVLSFGPVGAKHVLTVERAGKTRQVTLVLAELLP